MKISVSLALLPLAAQAALPANGWVGGRRGLALVAKRGPNGFTIATKDGGSGSVQFDGEPPKGGSFINNAAKDVEEALKDVPSKQDIKDLAPRIPGKKEDPVPRVGPFWESKLFKEGGLGFLFGVGTGVCARKANQGAAYAVTGTLVAAQYMSRADIFGCGGKLGWPRLGYFEQAEFVFERDNYGFLWKASRSIKATVRESLETCEGYALGLVVGLKGPIS